MKKMLKLFLFSALVFCGSLVITSAVSAATPTLSLSKVSGDVVRVQVSGDASSNIQLTFLPTGASSVTSFFFGVTNSSGSFSTSISSGGYGIPSGSPVYITVNGYQSSTVLWPSYTSTLTLTPSSAQIAVGETLTISGSSALIMPANSMSAYASVVISGSQARILGLSAGNGTINFCATNAGCVPLSVNVGGSGQSQVSFSENNLVLYNSQSRNVSIFGGGSRNYVVVSNSNTNSIETNISGSSAIISLYGKTTPGAASIKVCSAIDLSNCAILNVTILNNSAQALNFSQNNLSLVPSLAQMVTISGGPDNNYYISSNSNSGVVAATISGNALTVTGGSNSGTSVIAICSATVNARCGNLNVTNNASTISPSANTLSFSQNVVSIASGETSNVTITGGSGAGYLISSNSNPTAVTASINGNSNVVTFYGNAIGTATVQVCSTSAGVTCASLYVTVGNSQSPIIFRPNNTSQYDAHILLNEKKIISISGGSGADNLITGNSNQNVASAVLSSNGTVISLSGDGVGSATITICASTYSSNCATIYVTVAAPVSNGNSASNEAGSTGKVAGVTINDAVNDSTPTEIINFYFNSNCQYGSNSNSVKLLQEFLIDKNSGSAAKSLADYGANGNFGNLTKKALIEYQKANSLSPTGKLDVSTRAYINKLNYKIQRAITIKAGMLLRSYSKRIYVIEAGANKKLSKKYISSLKELAKYKNAKIIDVADSVLNNY